MRELPCYDMHIYVLYYTAIGYINYNRATRELPRLGSSLFFIHLVSMCRCIHINIMSIIMSRNNLCIYHACTSLCTNGPLIIDAIIILKIL